MATEEWPGTCRAKLDPAPLKRAGLSGNLSMPCSLPEDHDGEHYAGFLTPDENRVAFRIVWPR